MQKVFKYILPFALCLLQKHKDNKQQKECQIKWPDIQDQQTNYSVITV